MRRGRLAQRRKDVGLSQERLAEQVGVDRSTVVRWERGETSPQPWHRPHLAEALGISIERLAFLLAGGDERTAGALTVARSRETSGLEPENFGVRRGNLDESVLPDAARGDDTHQDGDVLRRDVLAHSLGVAASMMTAPLIKTLLASECVSGGPQPLDLAELGSAVVETKTAYQATRYAHALERLVRVLPAVDTARREAVSESRSGIHAIAAAAYHVASSVLLKYGDHPMALVAAERSMQYAAKASDPVAIGTSARIMTHALMGVGHAARAVDFAEETAKRIERATNLAGREAVAAYGALLLRAAIAAAQLDRRDTAVTLLDEAERAAKRLGSDGNDRWTGFGPTNVLQHRVTIALALGDAGTAIDHARQVPIMKIGLTERRASLFVDVAQAYAQWGRREQALSALQTAYGIAPEEIRSRPVVHRTVEDLAALTRGHLRTQVGSFAALAGVPL